MDILGLCVYAFAVAVAYESWWLFRSPLKGIPGPFMAKLTNIWRLFFVTRKQFHRVLMDMHKQYGSVVRIGPNVLSLSDPQWIRIVYSTRGDFEKVGSQYNDSRIVRTSSLMPVAERTLLRERRQDGRPNN